MHPLAWLAVKAVAYVVFVVLLATLTRPVRKRLEARARAWEDREIERLEKAHRESMRNVETTLIHQREHESFDFGAVRGTSSRSSGQSLGNAPNSLAEDERDVFQERLRHHTRNAKGH